MAIVRRVETRTETARIGGKVEEFTYTVEVWDGAPPAPFAYPDGVDAIGCEPTPGTFVKDRGWVPPAPAPEPAKPANPGRSAWVRAFFANVFPLPRTTVENVLRVADMVENARSGRPSRRVRKALARLDLADPATYYDRAALARLDHYVGAAAARRAARTAQSRKLAARLRVRRAAFAAPV